MYMCVMCTGSHDRCCVRAHLTFSVSADLQPSCSSADIEDLHKVQLTRGPMKMTMQHDYGSDNGY